MEIAREQQPVEFSSDVPSPLPACTYSAKSVGILCLTGFWFIDKAALSYKPYVIQFTRYLRYGSTSMYYTHAMSYC